MCLGIPGKVTDIYEDDGVLMGKVSFDGIAKKVCLDHLRDTKVGEYVLVHVGFALSKIDETEAKRVFELLKEMNELVDLEEPAP